MPPRNSDVVPTCPEVEEITKELASSESDGVGVPEAKQPPMEIVWRNVAWMAYIHMAALYGVCLIPWAHPMTWLFGK